MFYITKALGEKYGVIDTLDGVEEFYTKEQIESFKTQGIKIHSVSAMKKYVHFVWHFYMNSFEFGSSEFDEVLDYMEGKYNLNIGGSRQDYAQSLKNDYLEMKKLGFAVDLNSMFNSNDLLIRDLYSLYIENKKEFNPEANKSRCLKIATKWSVNKKDVVYYYG